MFDLSNELNRLYEFKGKVISKIGGKAIGVHVFPKGDVRELYKIEILYFMAKMFLMITLRRKY